MIGPFGLSPNRTMSSRALNLARALTRRGHDLALFMPPWQTPEEADRWWEEDGVTLRYTELGRQPVSTARNLLQDTASWQPDIVHGFKPKAYSGLAMWWLWTFRRNKQHIVLDMDDWEGAGGWNELAPYTAVEKRLFAWQEQWGMGHAGAVTVASRALESLVWSRGVDPAAVHYLPNGSGVALAGVAMPREQVEASRRQLGLNGRPAVLVYSRFFEFDTRRLVALLAGIKAAVPEVAILFIGESLYVDDGRELHAQLAEEGLLPALVDLGWVDEADLPLLLRSADLAVYLMDDTLINRAKCPVKLADLAGAGIPVIGEDVGQVSTYVVNGRTGALRPSGAVEGMIADAVALLQEPVRRHAFGQAALAHYRTNFDWDLLAGQLEAAYSSAQHG